MSDKMIFRNRIVDKGQLKNLIAWAFTHHGTARTAQMADRLKDLGFRYATKAGVSISVDDLQVPPSKQELIEAAESAIRSTEAQYARGEITEVERFQRVIDTWNSTSEALKDEVVRYFRATDPLNSVYMMAFSGARGNISQVRQLVGMRGLMANPQGEIIDLPIKTNFREGLTVTEYIISSYGARKGLVDTALRTADSGYLTRRLVDVSQDVIIRELDCGTQRGIPLSSMTDGDRILIPLKDRLLGRILARDAVHPQSGEVLAKRNQDLSEELARELVKAGVTDVEVRSPLTCEATRSVCQACYGWSLAHAKMVDLGEAVGIIAAQSIGEPGTQLTMRTFHTGGVFSGSAASVLAPCAGTVRYSEKLKTKKFTTPRGETAYLVESSNSKLFLVVDDVPETQSGVAALARQHVVSIPVETVLLVKDGERVQPGRELAQVPAARKGMRATERATKDVATDLSGEVVFAEIVGEEKRDRQGNTTRIARNGGLIWILSGEVYNLPPGAEPVVKNGATIGTGAVIAETTTRTEHGGTVRLATETDPNKGGREVEIVTASVLLDEARVLSSASGGKEQYTIVTPSNQRFSLKTAPGSKVLNNQVVAELIDDSYRTTTGGTLKYAGVESKRGKTKQGYEVIQGGTLLWIPEECHEVNKDISLLLVEDGQVVEAGTEVVKDIFATCSGVVEVTQKNDILREISIKPGDLHLIESPDWEIPAEGSLIPPGTPVFDNLTFPDLRYVQPMETPEGPAVLFRTVIEYQVPDEPRVPSQESSQEAGGSLIRLRAVQRLPFKDGDRIKSVEGVEILRTQLVLEINTSASEGERSTTPTELAADIELIPDETDPELLRLQLVILESLVIRRDVAADPTQGSTLTRLQVKDGDVIPAGAVVARTEIQSKEAGLVRGIKEGSQARRVLIVREADLLTVEAPNPMVNTGDLVVGGKDALAAGVVTPESGQVTEVKTPLDRLRTLISLPGLPKLQIDWSQIQEPEQVRELADILRQGLGVLAQSGTQVQNTLSAWRDTVSAWISSVFPAQTQESNTSKFEAWSSGLSAQSALSILQSLEAWINSGLPSQITLRLARPYRVSAGAILHVDAGDLVQRGDNLVLLVFERAKTGDIIQGLPRIEELLEARKPKEACVMAERPGTVQLVYGEDESVTIRVIEDDGTVADYTLSHGNALIVSDGMRVDAGQPLSDGPANPHQILEIFFNLYCKDQGVGALHEGSIKALQQVQTFLVNEVQSVYQSQGIDISDKHIEVIVRQMTSKARIEDGGDTTMLPGELVELYQIQQVNEAMSITGGAPAQYIPVLLGITKASLNTDSFISAASFQETTRVLTEAAIEGKSDWLRGLKENVIIGRLIPAGTGFNAYEESMSQVEETIPDYALGGDYEDDLKDVVLDDRTARNYRLMGDSGAGLRGGSFADSEAANLLGDYEDYEESDSEDDYEADLPPMIRSASKGSLKDAFSKSRPSSYSLSEPAYSDDEDEDDELIDDEMDDDDFDA